MISASVEQNPDDTDSMGQPSSAQTFANKSKKVLVIDDTADIRMIISESLVLTSVAGYTGIVAGVALLELAGRLTAQMPQAPVSEPEVDLAVVLLGGAILLAGGLIAAVMPARYATRILPVEALRTE